MAIKWDIGPKFPALNLYDQADAHTEAVGAMGVRLDKGGITGQEPPADIFSGVTADIRGLHYHTRNDGATPAQLLFTPTELYINGSLARKLDGTIFELSGTGLIRPVSDGFRCYFTDGSGPVYWWDERDTSDPPVVFANVLPVKAGDAISAVADIPAAVVHSLTNVTSESTIGAVLGFAGVGAVNFDSLKWDTTSFGVPTPRINTSGSNVAGDGFYYDYSVSGVTKPDWSQVTKLQVRAVSDKTGLLLAFVFGQDPIDTGQPNWGGNVVPFAFEPGKICTIPLSGIAMSERNSIQWWGFQLLSGDTQFVVNLKDLRMTMGTTGVRDYALTLRRTDGSGESETLFRGPENTNLKDIDAGTNGAEVTITFAEAVPVNHIMEVWRRDQDIAAGYHFIGTAAAAATTYKDSLMDASTGVTLKEGRVTAPSPAALVLSHHARLGIVQSGYLWLSAMGDQTFFLDMTPEQALDILAAGGPFSDFDPIKIPLGNIGNVVGAARFGTTTADAFRSDNLLMTSDGWDALLEGSTLDDIRIAQQKPGGLCGVYAWTLLKDGRVAKVDPDGDVTAVDKQLNAEWMSRNIKPRLKANVGPGVVMVDDRVAGRLNVLLSDVTMVLDPNGGGWVESAPRARATCAALLPGDDGGRAIVGGLGGSLWRLYDVDGVTGAWSYRTFEWNRMPSQWHCVSVQSGATGVVRVSVIVDGQVVETFTAAKAARRLPLKLGERVSLQFDGDAGSILHGVTAVLAERKM